MAAMAIQNITPNGVSPSYTAVTLAADTIATGGSEQVFLHVKNGGAASINVTIAAVVASVRVPGVGNVAVPDKVVAVGAGAEKMIGPFSAAYRDNGLVSPVYSASASVTAAALKLEKAV